jgi:hypothetical protein
MPEAPKQGFLKGLFGGGPKPLDREELFGEASGKASSSLAKSIPGAGMAALQVYSNVLYLPPIGRPNKFRNVKDRELFLDCKSSQNKVPLTIICIVQWQRGYRFLNGFSELKPEPYLGATPFYFQHVPVPFLIASMI